MAFLENLQFMTIYPIYVKIGQQFAAASTLV